MKVYKLFTLLFILFYSTSFAQKVLTHTVKSGESVYFLAKKYNVSESELFDLNPKLKGKVLALKTEVKIPNKKYKLEEKKPKFDIKKSVITEKKDISNTHLVAAKETIYSISKKYGITMESLCELNPELKTGNLKMGSVLKLPKKEHENTLEEEVVTVIQKENRQDIKDTKTTEMPDNVTMVHKVLPKETLYKISKIYNVSVKELQKLNPEIGSDLPVGYQLVVKKGVKPEENTVLLPESNVSNEVVNVKPLSPDTMSKASFLIAKASEHLGTRYKSGGTTSAGFDCSGLMFTTFMEIDMTLPRSSYEMANFGVRIDKSQAQKGDLIFFATFGKGRISHVGMITEINGDDVKFIHSSTSSGVIISSLQEDYYARNFVQINRVLKD